MSMGMLVTIVHDIDFDTASIIASEFGFEVENVSVEAEDLLEKIESRTEDMESRPPVVTIMGHVDHGKTTLLDAIRETDVAGHEAGGITQHIGAYNVTLPNGRQITFVDTPGHESFAAMRARGAQVTDIVVLVVAADDGIMPQTIESINHAKDANVTIVVAVNKIDKENANPERIRQELLAYGLVPEDLGGETLYAMISAKKRTGIEDLLDAILLQAEMMDLKSDPTRRGQAVVLDARLERGLGPVAAVLVKEGTLRKGNFIVADNFYGRLRMMFDDHGNEVAEALPGVPVQVIGLGGVPRAGVILNSVPDEKTAKAMATLRTNQARVDDYKKRAPVRLEDLYAQIKEGELKEIKILLKGDVQGSVEAVRDALEKLSNDDVKVRIIHSAVGTITETDINFASASNALVIGFSVRPETKVKMLAEQSKVEIRLYNVIYDLLNDIKASIQGMLPPTFTEVVNGVAEVRNTFHISKIGTVAGCYVLEGKIVRNSKVRLMRDGAVVYTGNIGNLKRFKDDAREVQTGFECGISIDGYNDVKLGDRIESYNVVESRPDAPES
jgi:translation initiation factor IF-2